MRDRFIVYDISNKVLKWGLSLYEWGAVILTGAISISIFHVGAEVFYDLFLTAGVILLLKYYKIGKPDGYVKSLMDFHLSVKEYHIHYKPEIKKIKNDDVSPKF